jgi:HlyD family secretion protein
MSKLKQIFKPIQRLIRWFRKTRTRNKIIIIIAVLLVGFFTYNQIKSSNAQPQYLTQAVKKANVTQIVSETGNVGSTNKTDIYSPANGIIEEIYVKNNDEVEIGQDLFKVKSTATEQEKAQTQATYLAAKNTLDTANSSLYSLQSTMFSKWDTYKTLAEGDYYENSDGSPKSEERTSAQFHIAEEDWLAAEGNYKKQQAVISQAQASLTSASLLYQATLDVVVKATTQGVVANSLISLGDTVSAKVTGTSISPVIVIISEESTTNIKVSLNEVDIPKVKEGQDVETTLDAFPGKTFKGTVKSIDTVGTDTSGVITYDVLIKINNPDPGIRPSMTANVDIQVAEAKNVLTVPNGAIKPYQGKKAVQIIDPQTKTAKYIPVEVGIKGPERTQIIRGINEGTQVITGTKNSAVKTSSSGSLGG